MMRRALFERCTLLALAAVAVACVAPPRNLDPKGARTPLRAVSTDAWNAMLAEHVDDGFVDYRAFCGSRDFAGFLEAVARADSSEASHSERLAFLLNAYNASAIRSVLEGRRPTSLLGRYTFFLRVRHAVAGERITLWDLEKDRIRTLGDPRIHFVLVCASASCPRLTSSAYRPGTIDAQLEAAARSFVNDPSRNRFYPEEGVAEISAIFDWFEEDFLAQASSLQEFLARYIDDPELARALRKGTFDLRFLPFDWSLNGVPPTAGASCSVP
jgi:hypothetical protein